MGNRGRLRVLLGAAPGVGKTCAMLEEGKRLQDNGVDVVIGLLETHGRTMTARMAEGLPQVPRRQVDHRGVELDEMDVRALLRRHPEVALVDELAHTDAPGSDHPKRWQDVEDLLDAGIDVISTVNIQHIESLNDVVEQITGIVQRETIPDTVLRHADQVEVVDLAPQALRDRLSSGDVYPSERINAALSNYFRLGNLTALRELALLWMADDVDQALKLYREEHGIEGRWEARERVVVALTGGPEGETLLRRGARIAARSSGGELIAVFVSNEDGLRSPRPTELIRQRQLVTTLGGTFHQLVGSDIPATLIDFAHSVNATQLVIGATRRGWLAKMLSGPGIGSIIIRESGDIDVHIVNHAAAARFTLPNLSAGAVSVRRRVVGFATLVTTGPLLTWGLAAARGPEMLAVVVLSYVLLTVVIAIIGGFWPAVTAALASGLALDFFFIDPRLTVSVGQIQHLMSLLLYIVTAVGVSMVVDRAARRARVARRASAESELLQTIAKSVLQGQDAISAVLERSRATLGLDGMSLVVADEVVEECGVMTGVPTTVPVGDHGVLNLYGDLDAPALRLMSAIASQIESVLEHRDLEATARELEPLTATDKVRTALLTAAGHDLRRPLAAASAAVGGLRSQGAHLSAADRAELLRTADEALGTLSLLVRDLLDVSRLQSGVLAVMTTAVDTADVVLACLDELHVGPGKVELDLDQTVPEACADPVLLQRAVVNVLSNAMRYEPDHRRVRVTTSCFANRVEIRIVDHGRGVAPERREEIFVPFQRLGDTDTTTGLGLGLALSKGFIEGMDGTLEPESTPGGGLTMVISLPDTRNADTDDEEG